MASDLNFEKLSLIGWKALYEYQIISRGYLSQVTGLHFVAER